MPRFEMNPSGAEQPLRLPVEALRLCDSGLREAAETRRLLEASMRRLSESKQPSAGSRALLHALMDALERLYDDESALRTHLRI